MTPRDFLRDPGFETALLLTWSIDPVFFETVHLSHLRKGGTGRVLVLADGHQLDRHAPHLGRLVRAGRVRGLGRSYALEGIRLNGHFHPKLWIRFGVEGGRVLVGSGNLTGHGWSGQWELASAWEVGPDQADSGAWLRPLLEDLRGRVQGGSSLRMLDKMLGSPWLPESETSVRPVLWSGAAPLGAQLRERWPERRFDRLVMLTGSTDQRGAMLEWAHQAFGVQMATVILSPSRAAFDSERLAELPLRVKLAPFDGGSRALHAKLAWFEGGDGPAAVVGSANCSASAWSQPLDALGNFELVAVFDRPNTADFSKLIQARGAAQQPEILVPQPAAEATPPPRGRPGTRVVFAEWDAVRREASVQVTPASSSLRLHHDGQVIDMHPRDGRWVAPLQPQRWPSLLRVEDSSGSLSAWHWLDDGNELFFGAHNQRWEGALSGLREQAAPSAHRKMVRDLTRLASELFVISPLARRRGQGGPGGHRSEEATPLDPSELEAAVAGPGQRAAAPHLFRAGVSLTGILAAVFHLADDSERGPERSTVSSGRGPAVRLTKADLGRIDTAMRQLFSSMDKPRWLRECSDDQFFQALALPLALALTGIEGGWLRRTEARVAGMVGGLVSRLAPHHAVAQTLSRRAEATPERFGDGKLLATARVAVALAPWGTRLQRTLHMRIVDQSEALRSAVTLDECGALLGCVRVAEEDRSIRDRAFDDVRALSRLERWMEANWEALGARQADVDWFRPGELVWFGRRRWARVSAESQVDRERTWVEYLDGPPPAAGRTDRGSASMIWRGDRTLLLNLNALTRAGVEVPKCAAIELRDVPVGPLEKRGAGQRTWD